MRRFMLPAACAAALVLSSCQSLTGALDDLGLDLGDSAVASKVVQTAVEVAPDIGGHGMQKGPRTSWANGDLGRHLGLTEALEPEAGLNGFDDSVHAQR